MVEDRKGMLTIAFLLVKIATATEYWLFLLAMPLGLIPIGRRALSAAGAGTRSRSKC